MDRGKWDEAEELYRELMSITPKTDPDRAALLNNLAIVLKRKGQSAEAETLQRESVRAQSANSP
jgi:hypothetical protein